MSAPVVPWATPREVRRMRRAIRELRQARPDLAAELLDGDGDVPSAGHTAAYEAALAELRTIYLRED